MAIQVTKKKTYLILLITMILRNLWAGKKYLIVTILLSVVTVIHYELNQTNPDAAHHEKISLDLGVSLQEDEVTPNSSFYVAKALRKIRYGVSQKCKPTFDIMYLKTHKCASSTMQNILFRYACTHNQKHELVPCGNSPDRMQKNKSEGDLPVASKDKNEEETDVNSNDGRPGREKGQPIFVAVPKDGVYAGSPQRFSARMLQSPRWLLPENGMVNMFGLHTRLDPQELQKILYPGSLWITVLRHPVELYHSLFTYFKINVSVKASFESFLKRPLENMKDAPRHDRRFGANQMTFDLGYDSDTFYSDDKIDVMIRDVEDTFDLILIAERMDESLVLLGHALCWSLDDLVSLSKNVRSQRSSFTPEERKKLEDLNYSDLRLYEYFSTKFEQITQLYGKDKLKEEVEVLRAKRSEIEKYCVKEMVPGHAGKASIKEYSGDVFGFELSRPEDPTCKALVWNSKQYISYFREGMRHRFSKRNSFL